MKFDLHIHSCLSPCANLEMSPREIVARAVKAGMQGIALTDHNSSKNCPAGAEWAPPAGPPFLSGPEGRAAEEIASLTLFDTVEAAAKMTDWVYEAMIKRVNDPEAFGDQPVVTADDDIVELEWRIRGSATRRSLVEVGDALSPVVGLGGQHLVAHGMI